MTPILPLEIIGTVGALIIVCVWAIEAIQSVERHKRLLDLKFTFTYIIATSFLVIHSIIIEDVVFIFLNSSILAAAVFETLYSIYLQRGTRKRTKLKNRRAK